MARHGVDTGTIVRLGTEAGLTVTQCAKMAGVAEITVKQWRQRLKLSREYRMVPEPLKQKGFTLSVEVIEGLRDHAKETGSTMSAIVERQLREYLGLPTWEQE